MLLFTLFPFALDVIFLVGNLLVVGYNNNYIANKLMVQGGLIGAQSKDVNDPSGGILFYGMATNEDIIRSTNKVLGMVGIGVNDWMMDVDGKRLYDAGKANYTLKTPLQYGDVADLTTSFRYKWRFTSGLLPGSVNMTFKKVSSFTSDYYRQSN